MSEQNSMTPREAIARAQHAVVLAQAAALGALLCETQNEERAVRRGCLSTLDAAARLLAEAHRLAWASEGAPEVLP